MTDYFGNIGEDFGKVIAYLAKEVTAGDYERMISLRVNNERKGWAYSIMFQQFRITVALPVTHNNACNKMARLHCARATPRQANEVVLAKQSCNTYMPGKREYSWFTPHNDQYITPADNSEIRMTSVYTRYTQKPV